MTVTVTDDDSAGFTLSQSTVTVNEGSTTTFTAVLDAQPASDVVIDASSDDGGAATVSPTSLTFTAADWNTPQTVTVTGVDDDDLPDESVTLTLTVDDANSDDNWDPLADQTVAVTVSDDDTAGVTLSQTTVTVGEAGTQSFTAVLDAQPASDVWSRSPRPTPEPPPSTRRR